MEESQGSPRKARYEAVLQELTMMSDMLARNVLKDRDCAAYVLQVILDDDSVLFAQKHFVTKLAFSAA